MEFGPLLQRIRAKSSSYGKENLITILTPISSLAQSKVACSRAWLDSNQDIMSKLFLSGGKTIRLSSKATSKLSGSTLRISIISTSRHSTTSKENK